MILFHFKEEYLKKLYLVRHGQTLFNRRAIIQGGCDSPLTDLGKRQALAAKKYFEDKNIVFDHAYVSTQERAVDTLEIITDLPYERLKGLKEWEFGLYEGESLELIPPVDPKRQTYGDFFVDFGGESDRDVQERVDSSIKELMNRKDHEHVLVVSHGAAIYLFLKKYKDIKHKELHFGNCCVLEFDYDGDKFDFLSLTNHQVE